jgi:cardiolipin synthase
MFGSANYDIRSFALNFELNLFVHAAEAVDEVRRLQADYLGQSLLATWDDWPSRTFAGRLKVNLAKLFSPLL